MTRNSKFFLKKIGIKNIEKCASRPKYVLLLPAALNRYKIALFECNCIWLLGNGGGKNIARTRDGVTLYVLGPKCRIYVSIPFKCRQIKLVYVVCFIVGA
jgi:hypothetical protein